MYGYQICRLGYTELPFPIFGRFLVSYFYVCIIDCFLLYLDVNIREHTIKYFFANIIQFRNIISWTNKRWWRQQNCTLFIYYMRNWLFNNFSSIWPLLWSRNSQFILKWKITFYVHFNGRPNYRKGKTSISLIGSRPPQMVFFFFFFPLEVLHNKMAVVIDNIGLYW